MSGRERPLEERSYGGWFLLASLLLVVVTVWSVYNETVTRRPWKSWQEEFRQLRLEMLDREIEAARAGLEKPGTREKLEKIEAGLKEARNALDGSEGREARREVKHAERAREDALQELIFLRSERDEAFYFWKRSLHRKKENARWKVRYEKLVDRVTAGEGKVALCDKNLASARARFEEYSAGVEKLTAERDAAYAELKRLLKEREGAARNVPGIVQIVAPDLEVVDRCRTCHLAVDRPGFDGPDVPEPFRTHPDSEVLLGRVHPPDRFGCTPCHRGQGPQIKGIGSRPFDHGRSDPYWEKPMLRAPFTEATCRGCHPEAWELELAPTLNRGKQMFADLACYACHLTEGFETARRMGPSLLAIAGKVDPDWLMAWLADPLALRPRTRMPLSWPVMSGREDPATLRSWGEEMKAVAAFLLDASSVTAGDTAAAAGDPERGRVLFIDRGCAGCHRPSALDLPPLQSRALLRDYGPDLSWMGSKTTTQWIASFLADPAAYFSDTRMPNLELALGEGEDIAAFLVSLKREEPFPRVLLEITPEQVEKGRALVSYYGCYNCHEIAGFEGGVMVGPDLAGFGDKSPHLLAFGDTVTDPALQTWERWTLLKLRDPRLFQTEKILLKMADNRLKDDEALAIAVYLLSQGAERVNPDYVRRLSTVEQGLARGARLINELNCRGCHLLDGDGGDVRLLIRDPGLVPPDLTGEGAKVQPSWLFQFLKRPEVLRPWLQMKMPNFGLSDDQANTLVGYFMARSGQAGFFAEVPLGMTPEEERGASRAFVELKCLQCHQLTVGPELTYSDLAPDMALTRYRLRPDWMEEFLVDPQSIQPGTKMPTFFPLEDDEDPSSIMTPLPRWLGGDPWEQIKAVRDFLYVLESQDSLAVDQGAGGGAGQ